LKAMGNIFQPAIKYYLVLLIICLGSIWLGSVIVPFKYSFPYVTDFLAKQGPWWLWPFANFDGVHYLLLAQDGYSRGLYQAFFPVYPLLIKVFTVFTHNLLISSLFISHLSAILAFVFLYRLLSLDYKPLVVQRIMLCLVFFPTSFFLLCGYSESLFLMLVFAFFWFLRQKKYTLASFLAGLATGTRLVGIFLVPALVYEYYQYLQRKKTRPPWLLLARNTLLSVSGLLSYLYFLNDRFHDPFKFFHVQSEFGANRSSDKLVLIYQVFYRYLKMIITVDRHNPIYFTLSLELMITLIFFGLLIMATFYKRYKIPTSYLLFSWLAFFLPTLTGTFSSMPRYILVCLAGFIILGRLKNRYFYWWLGLSMVMLVICSVLFFRGYWIA
jgi:hypothetical protein